LGIRNDTGRREKTILQIKANFRYCMNEDFTKIPDNLPQPNNDGKTNPLLGIHFQASYFHQQKK